ncbi:Ig-like domain-containing protein [Paenibacillus sp. strain BS8-2]
MRKVWRKTVAMFVMFALLTSIALPGWGSVANANYVSAIIWQEDFNDTVTGNYPASMSALTSSVNYSAEVAEIPDAVNKSLFIERTAANTTSSYANYTLQEADYAEKAIVEVRAKAMQSNVIAYIPVLRGADNLLTQVAFHSDGTIKAFRPAGWFTVASYQTDVWYDIRIDIDAESQTFDVYVDGTLAVDGETFRTNQPYLRQLQFGLQGGTNTGSLAIDEIKVSSLTEETEPSVAYTFEEDFEGLDIGLYPPSFDVETTVAGNRALTAAIPGDTGQSLSIERYEGNNAATYYMSKTLSEPQEQMLLSFRAMAGQQDTVAYIPILRGSSGAIAQIAFHSNGNIAVHQGGWITIMEGYEADHWYSFTLAVDASRGEFSIFIDGVLAGSGYTFQTAQTAITKVDFGLFRGPDPAVMYIDDVQITSLIPQSVTSVALSPSLLTIDTGEQVEINVEVTPADAYFYELAWSSSDEAVAIVDARGRVTGIDEGDAVITAEVTDSVTSQSYTATAVVEVVLQPATGITLQPEEATMPEGALIALDAAVLPMIASNRDIVWSSSDDAVAIVDGYGGVTAVSPGIAIITATSVDGGFTASSEITVTARPIQQSIYVSPSGDDPNAGTAQSPFASLERARDAARLLLANPLSGDIEIVLMPGVYELEESFKLDQQDSGNNGFDVVYRSQVEGEAIISGGRAIEGWQLHDSSKGIWRAPSEGITTRQLYVNGVRAIRARSEGGLTDAVKTGTGFTSKDISIANWSNPSAVEFVFLEQWTQPRVGVESVQLQSGGTEIAFTMKQPAWTASTTKGGTSVSKGPVYIENAYELLDREGEWYADDDYFYYKPRSFENVNEAVVTAPELEELLEVEGLSAEQRVHHIRFEGLSFAYTTWMWPSTEMGLPDVQNNQLRYPGQDDRLIEAAVTVKLAHHIVFERNTFSKIGSTGLQMIQGIQDSFIRGNRFYDISGSGLNVGEPTVNNAAIHSPSDERLLIRNVDITNNYVHDIGIEYASAAAISAGFPTDMEISNNHIFNIPYSGIHIGYGWYNFVSKGVKDVRVHDNYIHDLLGEGVYDGGAIYAVGYHAVSPDQHNTAIGNYIENQMNRTAVLYADNASRYWTFRSNVIDFTDTPQWPNYDLYWNRGTETELIFDNTYITGGKVHDLYGTTFTVTNTHVYPDANWPQEALSIIANAGLKDEYADLSSELERVLAPKVIDIGLNETYELSFEATKNKGEPSDLSSATIVYRSGDNSVVSVDSNGMLSGLSAGKTTVYSDILWGDLIRTVRTEVYVGDEVQSLGFRNVNGEGRVVTVGESLELGAFGLTELGRQRGLVTVQYSSSAPEVLTIDGNGVMTALMEGEAAVTVTATVDGIVHSRTLSIDVALYSSDQGLEIQPYLLNDELQDATNWKVSSGVVDHVNGEVLLTTPAGQGFYEGNTFLNELLTFNLHIDAEGGWQVIQIRNQNKASSLRDTYAIVIKQSEIELQRFNGGVRTVLFGNIPGFTSFGGDAYPNDVLPYRADRQIQVGAINEEHGVRIILNVDGVNIFYFLDKDVNRIQQEGWFSAVARYGTLKLGSASLEELHVQYDGNGHSSGDAPVDNIFYTQGMEVVMLDNTGALSKTGHVFGGWNTKADGSGLQLSPGSSLNVGGANLTLYAVWELEETGSGESIDDGPIAPGQDIGGKEEEIEHELESESEPEPGTEVMERFSDALGHWAFNSITWAVEQKIVEGYPDGTFRPDVPINRAELSVLLDRAISPGGAEANTVMFADTNDIPQWARGAVERLAALGWIKGEDGQRFAPLRQLTRAELAVIIYRALELPNGSDIGKRYKDESSIPTWAREAVFALYHAELMNGRDNHLFAPADTVTRAEALTLIRRARLWMENLD